MNLRIWKNGKLLKVYKNFNTFTRYANGKLQIVYYSEENSELQLMDEYTALDYSAFEVAKW